MPASSMTLPLLSILFPSRAFMVKFPSMVSTFELSSSSMAAPGELLSCVGPRIVPSPESVQLIPDLNNEKTLLSLPVKFPVTVTPFSIDMFVVLFSASENVFVLVISPTIFIFPPLAMAALSSAALLTLVKSKSWLP